MKKYRVRNMVKRQSIKNIMRKYAELNHSLNKEMSVEYWINEESNFAAELISSFSFEDWQTIEESWQRKPAIWQERLAKILATVPNDISFKILTGMVMSKHIGVVSEALESLSSISNGFKIGLETLELVEKKIHEAKISDRFRNKILDTLSQIRDNLS